MQKWVLHGESPVVPVDWEDDLMPILVNADTDEPEGGPDPAFDKDTIGDPVLIRQFYYKIQQLLLCYSDDNKEEIRKFIKSSHAPWHETEKKKFQDYCISIYCK